MDSFIFCLFCILFFEIVMYFNKQIAYWRELYLEKSLEFDELKKKIEEGV